MTKDVKNFEDQRWARDDQDLGFRHRTALELINQGPVLDLGCGDGLLLSRLNEKGIIGQGLDISSNAVDKCKSKNVQAEQYDFTDKSLPYEKNSFEYVVLLDILEHVFEPSRLLGEAIRVSRKCQMYASVPRQ